jgi:hypothetical protein
MTTASSQGSLQAAEKRPSYYPIADSALRAHNDDHYDVLAQTIRDAPEHGLNSTSAEAPHFRI